ncbi:endonuclease/exonuclease/phosphatase family protein [Ancylomarina longa]|uniref:endonuclease/exonuclease/phosphatase family protein n=1 Tax=Ancylomarina longa TaxID=2487017 RepID=UPI001ADE5BFC|nr:endonuclease/exonuclease/phosphatase family protein [Ancylomarina longa]
MRNILHKALVIFSLIFSGALLLTYLTPYISPEKFWPIAFGGLVYPYLLGINFLFVCYWIIRKKWSFLLPLIAILIGYQHLSNFAQFNFSAKPEHPKEAIKILTYNVRSFDKYEWTKDPKTPNNILKTISESDADIICLQEFRFTLSGLLSLKNLKQKTASNAYFYSNKRNGTAIFSKYPILHKGEIRFAKGNLCDAIYTDLLIGSKTIRVYNLHLESNRLGGKNYAFINKKEFNADEQELEEIKDISTRLRQAFQRRATQARIIRNHINKSPYPIIICGDFNDTAFSYTYHTIKGKLSDSFQEKGKGISTTYTGDFPSFRIDYVLHDEHFSCLSYKRIKKEYSDHFPVFSEFKFSKPAKN